MLRLDQITEAIRENGGNIEFIRVESDVDGLVENALGPWSYKDSKKVFIIYRSNDVEKKIKLFHMLGRGFPKSCNQENRFRYYSWLRLFQYPTVTLLWERVDQMVQKVHF